MAVLVADIQEKIVIPENIISLLEESGNLLLRLEGQPQECEVSVILVDNSYIRELNLTYRGEDRPTDVLAFNLADEFVEPDAERILGDVVVSVEKVQEQACTYGHSFAREITFLTLHGILHLLGYEHETIDAEQEMLEKKELVLKKFEL
ncbi:MAG: rRNA maturation RNase YbeY [Firmicutes bacterium]|nr:rRNA maturation RNase YbeY [Bacillota bacterium]